jgi:ATP-dependent RNA helicase DOB1
MEVEDYVEKFKPHIMDIVFAWCKGAKFADICKMTNIFEGTCALHTFILCTHTTWA